MNKLVWIVLAVLAIVIGIQVATHFFAVEPQLNSMQLLPVPKVLTDIKLEKNKTEIFAEADFIGHWNLIFFGFTSCPDFCPLELQKLGKLLQLSQKNKQPQSSFPLRVIFISLDPERDSPEKIKAYATFFHPQILGLGGSNFELAKVAHFFGSDYSRKAVKAGAALNIPAGIDMPSGVEQDYYVDHSARIYIVNPQAEYVGSFSPPHNTETMWSDLQLMIGKYKPVTK
jgi:protein SCO1/2